MYQRGAWSVRRCCRRLLPLGAVAGLVAGLVLSALSGKSGESLRDVAKTDDEMKDYKLVDTDGVPFSDAALSERMLGCARNPEAVRAMRADCRRSAETATWVAYRRRFAELIRSLVRESGR